MPEDFHDQLFNQIISKWAQTTIRCNKMPQNNPKATTERFEILRCRQADSVTLRRARRQPPAEPQTGVITPGVLICLV